MREKCVDRVVGDILAGWRYDISGITPEMRGDYEAHFAACEHCRAKRRLHRTIDIVLIGLASASALVFLIATLRLNMHSSWNWRRSPDSCSPCWYR